MKQNHPILVATDLSARTDRAVDRATMLASEASVHLIVCHVVESGSRLAGNAALANAAVEAVLPETEADIEILIMEGSAPSVILEQAKQNDCGLIISKRGLRAALRSAH